MIYLIFLPFFVHSTPPPPEPTLVAVVTAYSSSPEETDDTPNVNAAGTEPQDGSLACPREYAFGTKVRILGKEFTCDDRMNPKFADRFDIWMPSKQQALEFGIQTLPITIEQ